MHLGFAFSLVGRRRSRGTSNHRKLLLHLCSLHHFFDPLQRTYMTLPHVV